MYILTGMLLCKLHLKPSINIFITICSYMLCNEILRCLSENNSENKSEDTVVIFTVCKKTDFL